MLAKHSQSYLPQQYQMKASFLAMVDLFVTIQVNLQRPYTDWHQWIENQQWLNFQTPTSRILMVHPCSILQTHDSAKY